MKVFKIGVSSTPQFTGEKSDKTKKALRNTAGAAAIAVAAALPTEKADAQYYIPPPPIGYYYNYQPNVEVPSCFIYGDINNFDYGKTLDETFSEVDSKINENGVITAKEVVAAERDNWNATHLYPYNVYQQKVTLNNFNVLSRLFNEDDSNPQTINYSEYRKIMQAYMEAKNVNTFFNLLRILTVPRIVCPPPHHHHHNHRH